MFSIPGMSKVHNTLNDALTNTSYSTLNPTFIQTNHLKPAPTDCEHPLPNKTVLGSHDNSVAAQRPPAYGYRRYSWRGNGMVSRMWRVPAIQATQRSMPMPKPEWGTVP